MERVLTVRIDGEGAIRDARQLDDSLEKVDRSGEKASGTFSQLGRVISTIAFSALVTDMVRTIAEFDKLERTLQTFTGSAESASQVFDGLAQIAIDLAIPIEDTVFAFTKMRSLGLDPTSEALTSFANTAAASGKDLSQFIEAVADASTREFERLKEFGIVARQEGESVALTFQGVTTEIGNNSEEIVQFLTSIGNTQFAGAAENQAEGLAGAFTNLRNQAQLLFREIGEAGANEALTNFVNGFSSGLEVLANNVDTAVQAIILSFNLLESAILRVFLEIVEGLQFLEQRLQASDRFFNELAGNILDLDPAVSSFTDVIASLEQTIAENDEELKSTILQLRTLKLEADKTAPSIDDFGTEMEELTELSFGAARNLEDAAEQASEAEDSFRKLRDTLDPLGRLQRNFTQDLETLSRQFRLGKIDLDEFQELLARLTQTMEEDLKEATDDANDCLTEFEKNLQAINEITLDNIGDAFATFFSGLTLDFDRLFDDLVSIAQQRSKDLFNAAFQDILNNGITGANLGQLGQAALPGVIGGVFGSGVGQGAQLGSLLGSIIPGVGTVVGAIVGGLLGGIFDDSNPPRVEVVNTLSNADPSGIRSQSPFTDQFGNPIFVAGRQVTEEFGRQATQDALDALVAIDRVVFDLLDETQRRNVGQALVPGGNQETSQLFSGDFTIDEIAAARFDQILGGIGGTLEQLVRGTGFTSVEDGITALATFQNLFDVLNTDVGALRSEIAEGPGSLVSAFEEQRQAVIALGEGLDGSLGAAQAYEQGLVSLTQSTQQAFALIEATSQQIGARSQSTIFGLQFGALGTPEEQFSFIDAEIERLVNLLPTLQDPTQINNTLARIEQLTVQANQIARSMFTDDLGNFDQAGFDAFTQSQVAFLEEQTTIAQDLLTDIGDQLQEGLTEVFALGGEALVNSAQPIVSAAPIYANAADTMLLAAQISLQQAQTPIVIQANTAPVGAQRISG